MGPSQANVLHLADEPSHSHRRGRRREADRSKLGEPAMRVATPSTDCESGDRAASAHVATLVSEIGGAAELRLEEALAQLRRARKHCRAGSGQVARADYLRSNNFRRLITRKSQICDFRRITSKSIRGQSTF